MTWLVFGVSCLLVLAGAVSIISGAPIIPLERGWAEVISGTVALSSGGVVFALATVLLRLENLRETLSARAIAPAAEPPQGVSVETLLQPPPPAAVEIPSPPPPPAETAPPPESPDHAPAAEGALWKRIRRPGEQPDTRTLEQQGFPDRVIPDDRPAAAQPLAAAPVIVPPHPAPTAPATVEEPASAEPQAPSEPAQIGWLERSIGRNRAARPRPAEPALPAAAPEPALPALFGATEPDTSGRREPPLRVGATGAQPAPLEPEPTPDLAAEQHEGVSVVGRYQAGTSSYVMYSDGTIEVETEDGEIHRFGSMDELKAYIASQDSPAT
jgi:hypothetical protein